MSDSGMNSFRVRAATQDDLPAIYQIEDASFSDPYPHRLLARLLNDKSNDFLVAEMEIGRVVGYCVASKESGIAHLLSIGVLLEYRERGVGTALVRKLLENAGPGVKGMTLEVKKGNYEAIRLYESLGFKPVEVIAGYYSDGSAAVKMQLNIHDGA